MIAPRGRVPAPATSLVVVASALIFAGITIVADRVGPLTAHPRPIDTTPPRSVPGDTLPPVRPPVPPVSQPSGASAEWLWWIGFALAVLVAAGLLWWLIRALPRRRRAAPPTAGRPPSLVADAVLGRLTEPAEADLGDARTFRPQRAADDIIASFEAVERAAASSGHGRRPSATPTEFVTALVAFAGDVPLRHAAARHLPGDAAVVAELLPTGTAPAAEVLLRLYQRARFDTVTLVPGAATLARAAAGELVAALDLSHRARMAETGAPAAVGGRDR